MTARGKAWCLAVVCTVFMWWLVIAAVRVAVGALMPIFIWLDK